MKAFTVLAENLVERRDSIREEQTSAAVFTSGTQQIPAQQGGWESRLGPVTELLLKLRKTIGTFGNVLRDLKHAASSPQDFDGFWHNLRQEVKT